MKEWVLAALQHAGMSQAALSRELAANHKWPDNRSVLNKIVTGSRALSADEMFDISQATGYPIPAENLSEPGTRLVELKGYIGAGGHVEALDSGYEEIEAPADSHPLTVAAQIRGDSQLPVLQDGWIIYWSTQLPASSLLNQLAVVQLADGRIMVKTIRNGSQPGLFTLTSYNAADIVDVPVDWVAKIDWIKPR